MDSDTAYRRCFRDVLAALREESDRGCVLVGAAYLDDAIEEMLRARLALPTNDLFRHDAPLGSFSGKIDMVSGVGLLQPSLRASLHMIRRTQNDFAHKKFTRAFNDQPVTSRLQEVVAAEREFLATAWVLLIDEVPVLRNSGDSSVLADAKQFVAAVGTRATFEVLVSHLVAAFESAVADGKIVKLEALPDSRTY